MAAQRASAKTAKKTANKRATASTKTVRKPTPKPAARPARAPAKASRPKSAVRPAAKAGPTATRARSAAVAKAAGGGPKVKVRAQADTASNGAPVSEEPRLTKSPLSKSELEHYRDLLLEKRKELLGDVGSMESEAFKSGSNLSNMPIHMADVGTDNFEQEFTLGLIESERRILREIQEALQRIEAGTYGICLGTGRPIPKVRLEAVPWAKYTIEHSRALEQGLVKRDANQRRDKEDDDEE